jgi:hypothetical protein
MKQIHSYSGFIAWLVAFTQLMSNGECVPQETYHDNNPLCDCYAVESGGVLVFFHNYRFYDFRHYANKATDYMTEPPLVTDSGGNEPLTSSVFYEPPFVNDWGVQSWGIGPTSPGLLPRWNSPQNVYLRMFLSLLCPDWPSK